jgi:hypothetical protein
MISATSTSNAQAPPRITIVSGSGLGFAMPAIRNTPKISTRRHFRNRSWVRIPGVQAGRDERPELVEPDRRGQDHPGGQCDLHPQVERVERAVQDKLADHAVAQFAEVIRERHAALGVRLPRGAHEALADDAGARDGTGKRLLHGKEPLGETRCRVSFLAVGRGRGSGRGAWRAG